MYEVLDKDTIKIEILPHLLVAKRGYVSKGDLLEVILCILYKLKMDSQWHMLPYPPSSRKRCYTTRSCMGTFASGPWKVNGNKSEAYSGSATRPTWTCPAWIWTAAMPPPFVAGNVVASNPQEKKDHQCHICHRPTENAACHVHTHFGFSQRPLQHLRGTSGTIFGA